MSIKWSINALAEETGKTRRTIKKRIGALPSVEKIHGNPVWLLKDIGSAIFCQNSSKTGAEAVAIDPETLTPKARADWYSGTKLKRQLQIADGDLIPAKEVEEHLVDMVKDFVQALESLPDILDRDAGIGGAAVLRVREIVDAQREKLYATRIAER